MSPAQAFSQTPARVTVGLLAVPCTRVTYGHLRLIMSNARLSIPTPQSDIATAVRGRSTPSVPRLKTLASATALLSFASRNQAPGKCWQHSLHDRYRMSTCLPPVTSPVLSQAGHHSCHPLSVLLDALVSYSPFRAEKQSCLTSINQTTPSLHNILHWLPQETQKASGHFYGT